MKIELSKDAVNTIETILSNGYEVIVKTEKGRPVVIELQRKVKYKADN